MCTYFVRHGITPILHMDSEWTPFFKYFKHLPARKCILNLDGTSDIFKAKEVLGDHMCIMGDVPATLLKLGEPEEVDEYCRRLIEEVGAVAASSWGRAARCRWTRSPRTRKR